MSKENLVRKITRLGSFIGVLAASALTLHADVTLDGLHNDHMVLQRDKPVKIQGKADPGEKVKLSFAGQELSAVANGEGRWSITLPAMQASDTPAIMKVAGKNQIEIKDILIGDVWVCSGQSNMEYLMGSCGRPDDVKACDLPLIRHFQVPNLLADHPVSEVRNTWVVCSPQTAGNFTAVGMYFAAKVHRETGVPIGLIKSVWSGTPIEPWCSRLGMASVPELATDKLNLDKQIAEYRQSMTATLPKLEAYLAETRKALNDNKVDLPAPVQIPVHPVLRNVPCGWTSLYNGMIHPLVDYPIKGVLWYQGETNGGEGETYFHKLQALIGGWRKAWNQGDFPVYIVQLPNFQNPNDNPAGGDGWAKFRQAQSRVLSLPNTGMAVTIELANLGNPGDIHPCNKRDVGERLALWALAKDYGKTGLVYSGPLFKSMKIEEGRIRIQFDSVGSGLVAAGKKGFDPVVKTPGDKLKRFAIAGEDRKWVWADAVIDGGTVLVSSPSVAKPVAVRYAYSGNPDGCNLYNNEGLPAAPFRTDDW